MKEKKLAYINTWGCQMNVHDTERIKGVLAHEGYTLTDSTGVADLIIFNTCSIRKKAEQKFYSTLGTMKRLKQTKPGLKIAVTGCIAQQEGKNIHDSFSFVDFTIGPQNISKIPEALQEKKYVSFLDDNKDLETSTLPVIRDNQMRAWVNIMYGCNNFCTYCVVPYVRGRERSRPFMKIIDEIKELEEQGYKEVTLLGQNVNSYKGGCEFYELLERINEINGIERIRFITSHPKDLNIELIKVIANSKKICKHIHLPLQSGSTRILSLMDRKYTYNEYLDKVNKLREFIPNMAITSDIIAGFPGETEEDHKATITALEELKYDGIFAFKYSQRPFTKAAIMEGHLEESVKGERLKEILELQDIISEKINKALEGTILKILLEGPLESDLTRLTGKTETNKIVNFTADNNDLMVPGNTLDVEIIKGNRHSLDGRFVDL